MGVTDEDVQAAIDSGEWVQKEDKKTGKTYYSNKKTKATTWDLKKELAKQQKEGGDDGGGKKEKKEKKDKGEKKEKKEKKDKKAAAAEEEEAAEKPKDKDKDKKSKKDDKKKEEEKKEEKPAAAKKDAAKKKDDADKTSQAGLGSRKASVVSNVSKGADSMASVISNTPFIMPSDDLSRGNYMTAVTLETDKGVLDGPEMVYGWTDKECRLAASLRREQMRQKHFDKMSLRDYLGAHDDPNSNVVAADYFEGDGFGGAYAVGGLGGGSPGGGGGPLGVIRTSLSPRGGGGSPRSAHTQYEKTYDANPFLTYKTRPYPHSPPRSHNHHAASERSDDADLEAGRDGALRAAAACGDVGAAVSLLRSGLARVNEPRADGKTALHHAARYGHVDMVGLLLEAGADWRLRDAKGRTPADLARQLGQRAAAARLDAVAGQPHTPSAAAAAAAAATPSPLRGASPPRPYPPTQHQQPRHLRTSFYDPGLTGAPAPPAAMSPGEQTRQLKADVGEAMSGVTSLVRGWIREWAPDGGAPQQQQQQQQQHPPRAASPGGYGYGGGPPPQHPVHSGPLNPQPQPAYHPYQQQPQRFGEPPSAEGRISPMRRGGAGGGGAASIGLSPQGLPPSAAAGPYAGGGGYQPPLPGAAPRGRAPSPPQEMVDELTAAIWAASKGGGGGAGSMPPPPQQQQHPLPPSPLPPQFPPPAAAFRPSTSPPPPQYRRPDAYLLPNEGVDI